MTAIAKISIPSLADVSPVYRAALAKSAEIHNTRETITGRLRQLELALAAGSRGPAAARARELLDADDLASALGRTPDVESLRGEQQRLAGQLAALEAAAEQHHHDQQAALGEASRDLCLDLLPEYRRMTMALAAALVAAADAQAELTRLTDRLDAAGVRWSGTLRPTRSWLLDLSRAGPLSAWLKDMANAGLVDPGLRPASW